MKVDNLPEKDDETQAVSSSEAMDAYFFDMLGSVADQQPLKALEADADSPIRSESNERALEAEQDKVSSIPSAAHKTSLFPKPKLKPKPKAALQHDFAEPSVSKVSSLIIPAAFPKLAPAKLQQQAPVQKAEQTIVAPKPVSKETLEEKLSTKTGTAAKVKLDRKTALRILEEKKALLSSAQLAKLKAKLGEKEAPIDKRTEPAKVKAAPQAQVITDTQNDMSVRQTLKKPVVEQATVAVAEQAKSRTVSVDKPVEKKTALVSPGLPGESGPPAWAQGRFECLIFTVAGLKLAVPLASLGAIYKMEKELTPIIGRADYFMGLYRHQDRNVRVVDTAQWVMPDRWSVEAREGYQFIIRLGGNNWGMACDSVHESIQLDSDMVKWRSERTKRSWLSGTVIGHMCALLDADVLSLMLDEKVTGDGSVIS
jgi:purine-binding chemotaxis protein CheW